MTHYNVLVAPRARTQFSFRCDWRAMRFGQHACDTGRTIWVGPFVFDWSYRNINGHKYHCDCTACCIDWAVIDHKRVARLLSK